MPKPAIKTAAKLAMSSAGKRGKPSTPKSLAKPQTTKPKTASKLKAKHGEQKRLHPRNLHINGYDFPALMASFPKLKAFVRPTPYGALSIDFADPFAVKNLNAALLKHHYGLAFWDIPKGALCPPIPGRVDYLHYLADLLFEGAKVKRAAAIHALDIGTGADRKSVV